MTPEELDDIREVIRSHIVCDTYQPDLMFQVLSAAPKLLTEVDRLHGALREIRDMDETDFEASGFDAVYNTDKSPASRAVRAMQDKAREAMGEKA